MIGSPAVGLIQGDVMTGDWKKVRGGTFNSLSEHVSLHDIGTRDRSIASLVQKLIGDDSWTMDLGPNLVPDDLSLKLNSLQLSLRSVSPCHDFSRYLLPAAKIGLNL
jgi:hypothetical protein